MSTQNPEAGPLARAGIDLHEARQAAARVEELLEQVETDLRAVLEVEGHE
ncbi:hypothetical protein [Ornithinimicrobium avium]|nr:hypothetical protein [Ornithinimicrobium avium]